MLHRISKICLVFVGLVFSLTSEAAPKTASEFCQVASQQGFVELAKVRDNHFSFANPAGPFDWGSCWWHARLQRAALYLSIFRPELAKPTSEDQVRGMIRTWIAGNQVVQVNGYQDLSQLTYAWADAFRDEIGKWQMRELMLYQQWILAVRPDKQSAEYFQKVVAELYDRVEVQKRVTYVVVRYQGDLNRIHGILIVGVRPTGSGGEVMLDYIDSNHPRRVLSFRYVPGAVEMRLSTGSGPVYIQQDDEVERYADVHERFCKS